MDRTIRLFLAAAVLAISLACGITLNLPVDNIVTGPIQTQEISIDSPDVNVVDLALNFGAGELVVRPGDGGKLVQGTATYNVADFIPRLEVEEAQVNLSSGELEINGIPKINAKVENKWDLELNSHPVNLEIVAGAYKGDYEFGGLALKSLDITDGAADVRLRYSVPNLVEMEHMRYQTGASDVSLIGLANADFKSMIFRGGAGNYLLDFSGALKRDAVVVIEAGLSQLVIAVPEGSSATVNIKGGLMEVQSDEGWQKQGDSYIIGGASPLLTITVDMGAGNLVLKTIK